MRSPIQVRTSARVAAVAAVGTTLAISLTACGGESGNGSAGTVNLPADVALVKASQKTAQTDTFRASFTVTDASAGGSTVKASGQFRLRPSLSFSATLDEVSNNGRNLPFRGSQAIMVGDTLYAKVQGFAGQLVNNGKPWLKVDLRQAAGQAGLDFNQVVVDVVRLVDPAALTKMITASPDARRVGEATVDGVKTTHYTGSVTVQEALNKLDANTRQRFQRWNPNPNDKLNFDVWIDGDQLPRKLTAKGAPDETGISTITVNFRDYGKSVSVNAPPSDQVGEFRLPFFN